MDADIGGKAAGLGRVALPRVGVPRAARGDVDHVAGGRGVDGLAERDDGWVKAALKDDVDALGCLGLDF